MSKLALYENPAIFWARVDRTGDCWLWTGFRNPRGYGQVGVNGKLLLAHRHAWTLANGPIPDGLLVCHKCDNPPCVRLDHLFLGTPRDNVVDMVSKGRAFGGNRMASAARGDRHGSRTRPDRVPRGDRHGSKTRPGRTPRGQSVVTSKLTDGMVLEIRESTDALRETASRYGVTPQCIWAIRNRKLWSHL